MSKAAAQLCLWIICTLILCLLFGGCALFQKKGIATIGKNSVTAVQDAGKPATLATSDGKESVAIPKDTEVIITKDAATPTTPARETTRIHFNSPTEWQKFTATVAANTGTVDTSIAKQKIDAAESRPLLYASIGAALAAGFFLYRAYPTPAFICGGAAVVFFMSWKASGLPDWFWAVGACALAGAVALYLGHERGEKAAVVAGTPVTPVEIKPPVFSPTVTPNQKVDNSGTPA